MKKVLFILLLFVFLFLFPTRTNAESNFSILYNVRYDALENQNTKIFFDIELKNKTLDFYASSYNLQTGFNKIDNIKVTQLGQTLKHRVVENERGVTVSFDFTKNEIGLNKSQKFQIYFETEEVAKNYGNIWEVNIPGITNQSEFEKFNVTLNFPTVYGQPTIIKPSVKDLRSTGTSLFFSKEDLKNGGISIAFGDNQIYKFNLTYNIENKKLSPVKTEIAIPSTNNYQQVKINEMNPRPIDVYIDNDGNWLAEYKLLPKQKLSVNVMGIAKVSYKPVKEILSSKQKAIYLKPQKYWESDNAQIKKLANELKTPENIYKFVVDNLKYDSSRIKGGQIRVGAYKVLNKKDSAVCLEFTDLFIGLSRAAGIPARAVEGYANTNNSAQRPLSLLKDVLHAWPEYYDFDKKTWVMVDPTWENTTGGIDYFRVFDFDHLVFVKKGEDSEYPVSAGGYKFEDSLNTKDVLVSVSKYSDFSNPILSASLNFKEKYLSGFPITGTIEIINSSGVLSPNQTLSLTSKYFSPHTQNLFFNKIPPFGKEIIPVSFNSKDFLTNGRGIIKIQINKESIEDEISVQPFYKNIFFILGGIIIGSAIGLLSFTAYKRRRIPVS